MSTTANEGVIKFRLDFEFGPAPKDETLSELNAWRQIFCQLGLLGQDPRRYEGLGFGNLSRRADSSAEAFVISGTQTGGFSTLNPEHYVTVLSCDPEQNRVTAKGPIHPSSEALTHGTLYRRSPAVQWVMHLHSPTLFKSRDRLALPTTDPAAEYGTPQMAAEIVRLFDLAPQGQAGLIVMGGHKDGVVAFGPTAGETGQLVVATLAQALVHRPSA
jgi:hypothetical protein